MLALRYAGCIFFGKPHAGVDYDGFPGVPQRKHVHSEHTDPAQRDYFKLLVGHILVW
jgi:hypothetical protein